MSLASLASLLKQSAIRDDDEILRAADAALKSSKNDLEAQHVKVVALLKLDRYADAIAALNAGGEQLKERAGLEHAYALYKSGNPAAAAELAAKEQSRGYTHVEAQSRYRTEDFARAAQLYKQLAGDLGVDAEADLRINSGAVDAQLEWSGRGELVGKKKPEREDLQAFETAYNAACGSIARGELGQGEVLLKRAADLCASLEDLSEEEREAELLPIRVQRVYVLSRLGREKEAEELAQSLDVKSINDAVTCHVAQVNSTAASSTPSPYIAERLVSKDLGSFKPDHPFHFQTSILQRNRHAIALQALKFDGTAESTAETLKKQSLPSTDPYVASLSVANAAAHAKGKTGKDALKFVLPVLERRPHDIGLALTIAQLYTSSGNPAAAISLLESFSKGLSENDGARFAPGLVATKVSLYLSQGRKGNARAELTQAALHHRQKAQQRPTGVTHLLKAAGKASLETESSDSLKLAKDIFQDLHAADPSDRYAAAGLLAASPETASEQDLASLTPVQRLVNSIGVDALENAGVAQLPSAAPITRKRPAEDSKPKKAKKLRKSRLPKDYDPNKKPDPERWLPLRDRSTYRPKGKKAKARQALFSQGAVANESEGSRPATPGGEVVQQKQKQGGGGANKKKKGKGGKW
ncbi:hypothetical protein CKM354_000865200 [Cercospora kikuchii]|uniref:Signal recognition particle subunit SRP72 n=1 Tax=Cercospora kikuchii TaxID=84275 RepID=A0A9P3CJB5_9PEZI|nr:signal recognition particle subunit SRP72 [Cercospora kikuchii]GIZ45489.1 hypothetical protein CKM354_000865200 [Cercospora kikuchii]